MEHTPSRRNEVQFDALVAHGPGASLSPFLRTVRHPDIARHREVRGGGGKKSYVLFCVVFGRLPSHPPPTRRSPAPRRNLLHHCLDSGHVASIATFTFTARCLSLPQICV